MDIAPSLWKEQNGCLQRPLIDKPMLSDDARGIAKDPDIPVGAVPMAERSYAPRNNCICNSAAHGRVFISRYWHVNMLPLTLGQSVVFIKFPTPSTTGIPLYFLRKEL